jgi:hypothetical protein
MSKIFFDCEDVIVFIDSIMLFTNETFEHHLSRLSSILDQIQVQNLQLHVEETFLAAQKVDYFALCHRLGL